MRSISEASLKGLPKYATAPASNACDRSFSQMWAVRKMMGGHFPSSFNRFCKSKPFIPGIRTSVMRHDVRSTKPEARKTSADAKVSASYPRDSNRFLIPSRAKLLSSTIEINEMFVPHSVWPLGGRGNAATLQQCHNCKITRKSLTFVPHPWRVISRVLSLYSR
jgi:hypothetical protein